MHIPQALNQDLGRLSVTEVVLDYNTRSATYGINIPNLALVEKVIVCTEIAFAGGNPTLTVGDSDADGFIASADLVPGTEGAVANSATVATPNAYQEGRFYPSGGTLSLAWGANAASTAGRYRVLIFSRAA